MRKLAKPVVFDAEIAARVGINAAIIFGRIEWSISRNVDLNDQVFFKDKTWWMCATHADFESYSTLGIGQIKRALKTLIELNMILTSQEHNLSKMDRRVWFALESKRPHVLYSYSDREREKEKENFNHTHTHTHTETETRAYAGQDEEGGTNRSELSLSAIGRPEGIEGEDGAGICSKTNRMACSTALNHSTLAEVLFGRLDALSVESDAGNPYVREIIQSSHRAQAEELASQCLQTQKEWVTHFPNDIETNNPPNVWFEIFMHLVNTYENSKLIIRDLLRFIQSDDFWAKRILRKDDLMKVSTSNDKLFFVDQIILRMGKDYAKRRGG